MGGAVLSKVQNSGGYVGQVQSYEVVAGHSSLLAMGDFVLETGTGNAATGKAEVDAATAGSLITGVIVGIAPNFENLEQKGLPAGTAGTVLVQVDPMALYELDISTVAVDEDDIGLNAPIVATAATSSGNLVSSNMTLNGTTLITATDQLRVVGLVQDDTGVLGLGAIGNKALVRINESTIKGVVGV